MTLFDIIDGEGIIPYGMDVIPSGAFCDCDELERIVIPDSVLKIEKHAFRNCPSLREIFIPQSVSLIEVGAFGYCPNVETIEVHPENQVYDSRKGCNAIVVSAKRSVLFGAGKSIHELPKSIRRIESEAYAGCSGIFKLMLPSHIKSIGEGAFRDALDLNVLIIMENSIGTIPAYAFSGACVWEVQFWGTNVEKIDSTAFDNGFTGAIRFKVPEEKVDFYRALLPEHISAEVDKL